MLKEQLKKILGDIPLKKCKVINLETGNTRKKVTYKMLEKGSWRIITPDNQTIDVIDGQIKLKTEKVTLENVILVPGYFAFKVDGKSYQTFISDRYYKQILSLLKDHVENASMGIYTIPIDKFSLIKKFIGYSLLEEYGFIKSKETGDYILDDQYILPKSLVKYLDDIAANSIYEDPIKFAKFLKAIKLFVKKLKKNPVGYIIDQIADFIANGKLPITETGTILAYKKVNPDYTSIWDGKTSHKIGEVVSLLLSQCDTNPNVACSSGLHVCSYTYLPMFGAHNVSDCRIVVCEIEPYDVVAVPNSEIYKMRCKRYRVIADVTEEVFEHGDILSRYGFYLKSE